METFSFMNFFMKEAKSKIEKFTQENNLGSLRSEYSIYNQYYHHTKQTNSYTHHAFTLKILLNRILDKKLVSKYQRFEVIYDKPGLLHDNSITCRTTHQDETSKFNLNGTLQALEVIKICTLN